MRPASISSFQLSLAILLVISIAGYYGAPSKYLEHRSNFIAGPYIISGEHTDIEKVPYQIAIEVLRVYFCSGVIISENYALTAAHCLDPTISGPWFSKRIRAGSTTEFLFGWGGVIHKIADVDTHPDWRKQTIDYDLGIIKVSTPFKYSNRVQPILVPSIGESFINYNLNATASGWGLTKEHASFSSWRLKKIDIPLVARPKCYDIHKGTKYNITDRMICGAGDGNGGPCLGDSGGPLVHRGQLIGLVSGALRCNDDRFPTVFTSVLNAEIRQLIKRITDI